MRKLLLSSILVVAACGSSSDSIPDARPGCTTADCNAVTGSLSNLLWELPCGATLDSLTCASTLVSTSATVAGTDAVTYSVVIHVRGVVETKSYVGGGGVTSGYWTAGGTAPYDGYNVYQLSISSPAQTYFLNSGPSNIQIVNAIDYQETIQATAGATVTLSADPADGAEVLNIDANLQPVSITGTTVTQPYNGQFIEMDVVSVEPVGA